MWLQVGNVYSKLTQYTEEEREWLTDYLTFEGARKGRFSSPPTKLFNLFNYTYPSGFNPMVVKAAKEEGFEVRLVDARKAPCAPDANADLDWLRDYQLGAVEKIVETKRGILWLPTGAGKTEVIVGLTRALPCRWLTLVHRSQLADDIASRYELRSKGLFAGRILEGSWDTPKDATIISATYQSIQANLKRGIEDPSDERYLETRKLLAEVEGILIDECHTLPADSFYRLAMMTKGAYYRVGLSGTPLARGDRKSMFAIAALGPVVYRVRSSLLIGRGVLAKPTVRMKRHTQESNKATWDGVYKDLVVRSKSRNEVVAELTARATKPAFVFVQQTAHGKELVKVLYKAGIRAEFVWGTHSIDYRKSLIKRLVAGHFDVIVCSAIFNEGIDVPELRAVVNAAGGKSLIAVYQRLGRGMRIDKDANGKVREGGDVFEVYDILDEGNKWTTRHAKARLQAVQAEGYETYLE